MSNIHKPQFLNYLHLHALADQKVFSSENMGDCEMRSLRRNGIHTTRIYNIVMQPAELQS
jgi:hypothetical protein